MPSAHAQETFGSSSRAHLGINRQQQRQQHQCGKARRQRNRRSGEPTTGRRPRPPQSLDGLWTMELERRPWGRDGSGWQCIWSSTKLTWPLSLSDDRPRSAIRRQCGRIRSRAWPMKMAWPTCPLPTPRVFRLQRVELNHDGVLVVGLYL